MDLTGKKIGIWGYAIVGKSLIRYLSKKNVLLSVIEKRKFDESEIKFFKENNIIYYNQDSDLDNFLQENDYVISSPGIDLRNYNKYKHKWLSELDLFSANFKKPIIAITGTVGKTTITTFLEQLLKKRGKNIIAAGNIGIGMCDLIEIQDDLDGIILELSSFQLEYCTGFDPALAIWTNFYPNHLDRHSNLECYFQAKSKIFKNQNNSNIVLLPLSISHKVDIALNCKLNYFSLERPEQRMLKDINFINIFFIQDNHICKMNNRFETEFIFNMNNLPQISYLENWLIIFASLYLQKISLDLNDVNFELLEHRFEKFVTIKNVDFYNDSKSTIPDTTLAAVNKLTNKSVILFLGGISKGVDRSPMIFALKNKVKKIICFGKEANELKRYCDLNKIESYEFVDLESAVTHCFEIMKPNDQVLFSPSGASFDLYKNYMERGTVFKQLVSNFNK